MLILTSCAPTTDVADGEKDSVAEEVCHKIIFDGRRYTYEGDKECFFVKDDVFTIKRSGVYILSGELTEGRIVVDCEDIGAVSLVLDGITARSSFGAVIESKSDLILHAKENTVNIFSNERYKGEGADAITSCIVSHKDLIFTGKGSTVVNSKNSSGVLAFCNVIIDGGAFTVSSAKYGVWARDGFVLDGGAVTVSYAKTGISTDSAQSSRGYIRMGGGKFVAQCDEVALAAKGEITVIGTEGSIKSPTLYKCDGSVRIDSEKFPKK